jgi:V/A-type H+-transporting ATPase subunit I
MSIRKTLKAYIICPSREKDSVLKKIQLWGNMELIEIEKTAAGEPLSQKTVSRLEFIIDFLREFVAEKSAWQRLKQGLPVVDSTKIKEIELGADIGRDYEELRGIEAVIKESNSKIEEFHREIKELKQIKYIPFSGSQLELKTARICIARVEKEFLDGLIRQEKVYVEIIHDADKPIVAVFYSQKHSEEALKIIHEHCLHRLSLPRDRAPGQRIDDLKESIGAYKCETERLAKEIREKYADKFFEYKILLDIHNNRKDLETESAKLGKTKYMSVISGWMPAELTKELENLVKQDWPSCHIEFQKPQKDDDPPVILKNTRFNSPFEVVTNLYGTPSYDWIDPTPYLAPFFAFFFGLCITDAGYGIVITGLCLLAILKLRLTQGVRKFMKLLMLGGIATIIAGALTGGWFGNVLKNVEIVNRIPLKSPSIFCIFR